jgi:hypothetical protein
MHTGRRSHSRRTSKKRMGFWLMAVVGGIVPHGTPTCLAKLNRRTAIAAIPLIVPSIASASPFDTLNARLKGLQTDEAAERLEESEELAMVNELRMLKKAEEFESRDLQRLLEASKNPFGRVTNPIDRDRFARKADADMDNRAAIKAAESLIKQEIIDGSAKVRAQQKKVEDDRFAILGVR